MGTSGHTSNGKVPSGAGVVATGDRKAASSLSVLVVTSRADHEVLKRLARAWRLPVELDVVNDLDAAARRFEAGTPDVVAYLNVSPPAHLDGRSQTNSLAIRGNLAVAKSDPRGGDSVGIVAQAHWKENGSVDPTLVASAWAPIYPKDAPWHVRARSRELAIRVFEQSLRRAIAEQLSPTPLPDRQSSRPLTKGERLRWQLVQGWRRFRSTVNPVFLLKNAAAIMILLIIRPVRDLYRTSKKRHPVRVFTFHRISDLSRDGLTVSPEIFHRQLQYVCKHHRVLDINKGLELLRGDVALREPIALITFDDAYRSVYEFGASIMAEMRVPGCCFVTTDFVGVDRRYPWDSDSLVRDFLQVMSWDELGTLLESGWTIGGHTATHPRLSTCDEITAQRELSEALGALKRSLGVAQAPTAYPFGGRDDITDDIVDRVEAVGYTACFSNFGGENVPPADAYRLKRIDIGGDHLTLAWKLWVHGIDNAGWKRRMLRRVGR